DKDGNTQTVTTKVDGEGNYKVDVPEALPEGEFTVTGVVTDPAGNPSEPALDTGTIDTVPPTLTITVPELGNDNTPTISGTSDAPEGSEVVITITDKDGNTQTVTTKVDGEGNYKVDVPEALPEGEFTVTGVVTDPAGNPSEPALDTGTVDTVPPTLTITVPELGNDNTPTISGTSDAPEGSEVVITITDKDGNTQTVTTKVDGEGNYKVDVPEALPEGEFTVTGVVTDPAGNPSEPALDTGTVDTVPPTLTITVPELGNDNTPTISGTSDAPEGSEVVITITDKDGNTQTVTTKVDGEGNYKVDVPEALPEGEFTVTGVVTDPAGNSTTSTDKGTVDTVPPVIDITGPIAGDDVISQVESGNPLEISGTTTAENGQIVTVTLDGNTYTATVTDGAWSLTVPEEDVQGLSQGDLKISADVSDKAGNPANDTHDIFVDTLPPVIDSVDAETDEDETVVFTWENFGITDANTDVTKLIVSITTLPTDGVLYLNGEAVTLGTTMSYDDIQAGRLTYVPNHNVSSDVAGRPLTNVGFSVSDGVNESTGSVDIVINAVADAPTIDFSEVTLVEPSLGLLETSIYYGAFTGLGSGGSGITYKDFNASFGSQKDATYQGKFSTDSINSANASNRDNILKQYETTLESNAKVKAYLDQGYTIKSFTRIQNGSGYDLVAGNNTGFYVVVTNGTKDVNVTVSLPTYTTVAETKGIIYLEAGQTYTFSGTFDDSAGIFIGAGTSVTDSTTGKTVTGGDGAWFKGYGTTSKFVFTVEEDGYYDFRFVTHNQSGPGGYVLTLNGKELNSDNFTLFPTPESLIEAAQADSNSDKIRIEYFTDPTTGTGHYKLYNANEGVTGKYVPLNAINVQLTDTDGSESISSVTLSGIPAGVTITDGNHIIISDGVTPIDVSKWNLDDLRVNSDVAQEFDITVTATSTEQSNQDSASSTGKIHVSIEEGANGEVIYPTDTTAPTLDAISVYDDGRVTFEFSEQVKYFDEGDIKVTGGTLKAGSLVDNGDGTWSAEIIPDADATEITVDVENNSYTDLAGNFGTGNTGSVTVTPPATSHAPSIDFEINSYTEVSTNGDLNGGREWNGSSYNGSWTINNPGSINDMKGAIGFDADNGNAIVSQTINTALPENAKLLIDLGWNNGWVPDGGSVATATFSFAGVDVLKVETTEGKAGALTYDANGKAVLADDVMYATVTVMNGASVTVNGVTYQSGESFQLKSWAQILNDTDHRNDAEYMASRWTSITVDLPSSLQGQTGTLAVSLVGGQDDIQIGALKVVTESGESSISSSTNVPTKVFSTISISDTDNDIASVQLKLTNSTDSTLTVQKDLLTDIFDVNFENGILTITEKSGVEATNDDWNSILASTTYFSSNSNANTITVTVTDSENQTASKSVDINGGVSTLTAKSSFALADSTTDDVIFNLLSDDNTGGNTETTDDHFVVGSTQTIDVSALLSDDATQTNIAEYVNVNYDANAQTATISIDRDGAGQAYQNADLLILTNQSSNVTLEQLLQNNQIIV
ncbi:Ig-like domain-containing protein, partial [Acinetobacter gerneri]|uniref:Ig-like domain-containing protein n=1 Tax=Acinetobacter gerneri TaxID=202952 RepID=UPI0023F46C59